jgi:hypothetical protein
MAIVATFDFTDPIDKYYEIMKLGGDRLLDQPERLTHVCYRTDSGFSVLDVWADEQSFRRFGDTLMPLFQQLGLRSEPHIYQCENTIDQQGRQTTARLAA